MKIAFLGDSITFGYALADKAKRYSTLVCEELGAEEENHGITGTLVAKAGQNRKDDKSFVSRAHLIDDGDVAVVFGGTNDYFWSDTAITGEDDSFFEHALESSIARIKEKRAGKITLFVTPYSHSGEGNFLGGEHWQCANRHDTTATNYNGYTLLDYVNLIEKVCEKHGVPCLNLHKNFPFDWRVHTTDGCHPNEAGHTLIAQAVSAKLKELLAKN